MTTNPQFSMQVLVGGTRLTAPKRPISDKPLSQTVARPAVRKLAIASRRSPKRSVAPRVRWVRPGRTTPHRRRASVVGPS